MGRILFALLLVLAAGSAHAAPTEWWLFAAQLETGDRVLVELTLTDVGPGERNVAAIGNWQRADGSLVPFSRAKLGGEWTSSAGGRRVDLQKFVFDRSAQRAQLRVEKGSLKLALDFALPAGPVATRALAGGKWTQELWTGASALDASLWQRGMTVPVRAKGRIAVSRRLIVGAEAKLAARRLEAFTLDSAALYVVEIARAGAAERWVVALDASGAKLVVLARAGQVCFKDTRHAVELVLKRARRLEQRPLRRVATVANDVSRMRLESGETLAWDSAGTMGNLLPETSAETSTTTAPDWYSVIHSATVPRSAPTTNDSSKSETPRSRWRMSVSRLSLESAKQCAAFRPILSASRPPSRHGSWPRNSSRPSRNG